MSFLSKLFGNEPKPAPEPKISPYDIVAKFGEVLELRAPAPLCVADISELPYPKNDIKLAIAVLLEVTKDSKTREHLKIGYLALAHWQPGVGPKHQGLDPSKIDLRKSVDEVIKEYRPGMEQMSDWIKITQAEEAALVDELRQLGFK